MVRRVCSGGMLQISCPKRRGSGAVGTVGTVSAVGTVGTVGTVSAVGTGMSDR